jgi:WD40 repeat protein
MGKTGPKRTDSPSQKLEIGYVYGYRSYDTRSNLKYNSEGNVVYHTAACGIILNKLKNSQIINTEHNDDITCLDLNVKKNLVVTGEMGKNPIVTVWDALTGKTIQVFSHPKLIKSIAAVAISPSGKYVAAVSMCDDHDIFVFDIPSKSLVAFGKGPKSVVYHIKFNAEENTVIMACDKQVAFASFSKGQLGCKKGVFGKAPVAQCYSVAVGKNGDCLISQQNGILTLWKGNSCTKVFKDHTKTVYAVC